MGKAHDVPLAIRRWASCATSRDARPEPACVPRPADAVAQQYGAGDAPAALGIDATVHGMRASARTWMADQGVPFEIAEACLAHTVGNAVVQSYQRSSMLEFRRPILQQWADFICPADNVVDQGRGVMIGDKSAFTNLDRKVRRGRVLPLGCVLKLRTLRWRLARPPPTLPTPTFTAVYSDKGS